MRSEMVLFPAPDIPVNQRVKPLSSMPRFQDLTDQHIHLSDRLSVRCKVQSALLRHTCFPPPSTGPLILTRFRRPATRSAPDAGVALSVQRMNRHVVRLRIGANILYGPICKRADL